MSVSQTLKDATKSPGTAPWQGAAVDLQPPGGLYQMRGKFNISNVGLPSNLTCIWHCVGAHLTSGNGRGEAKCNHSF